MTTDPLAPLLDLADVSAALDDARSAVDHALASRRSWSGATAAEVALRTAVASSALEGREYAVAAVRDGTVTDPVLQGCVRVSGALPSLSTAWTRAPRQVLARLHLLSGRDVVPPEELGRPVGETAAARLDALAGLVAGGTSAPALLLAAVVHGELLALGAFPGVNGVVARAAARLTLISGGLDPRGLLPVDVGHLARQPEYVGAAGAFATGTPDGLRSWVKHCAAAVSEAAGELTAVVGAVGRSPSGEA